MADASLYAVLRTLRSTPHLDTFEAGVSARRSELTETLITVEAGADFRFIQGQIHELSELLALVHRVRTDQ